jgi:glycosyltransferase involved in cell wall biosynthesis
VIPANSSDETISRNESLRLQQAISASGVLAATASVQGHGVAAVHRPMRADAERRESRHHGADPGPTARPAGLVSKVLEKARQGPKALAVAIVHRVLHRPRAAYARIRRAVFLKWSAGLIFARRWGGGPVRCPSVPGLVSVILPVYNQADLLVDSIESVLNQTYEDFELIVVNDGSTDGVERVLARYVGHPKVRVLTQANQQLPKALSNGFAFARGEYWTWTSADNLMHPDHLARQVAFLRDHPETSLVYADYLAIDDAGNPLSDPSFRPQNRRSPECPEIHLPRDPRLVNLVQDNFIGPCFLYRALVGRVIGEYDPNLGLEDFDYWMRVNHAFPIAHLGTDELLYRYRVHYRSLSARAAELKIVERAGLLMDYERLRQEFYRRPWTLVLDEPMKRRLTDGRSAPLPALDLREAADLGPSFGRDTEKVLYLIDSANLETLAGAARPAGARVAAWFDGIDDAYERWSEAARCGVIAITDRREVAERLDLLGIEAFAVGTRSDVLDLARIHANNRAYYEMTRPQALRSRTLPRPLRPPASQHVLVQVDHFDRGGMENMIVGLADGLRRRGVEVSLLVLGKLGPAAADARAAGIPIWSLPVERRGEAYRALLREREVDVVNAHYSTYGAAIAARAGVPFVQVVHNSYVWLDERTIAEYRAADPDTTAYLCVSAQVARYSDTYLGLSVDKMVVVPNGIDTSRLDAAQSVPTGHLRDELGLSRDDFVFLNVASIHATKAHTALVQAFAHVVESQPRARLLIVGPVADAEYEARIRRLIRRAHVEQSVILAGPRDDVARFYWMADAFVMPSYWEGWSLALTEAAYTGLPIVATDVGGARELLAEAPSRLVKPPYDAIGDLNSRTIGRVVHGHDAPFIVRLGEAMTDIAGRLRRADLTEGRKRLLDQERMVDLHFTILNWLLQGGPASSARPWVWQAARSPGIVASTLGAMDAA